MARIEQIHQTALFKWAAYVQYLQRPLTTWLYHVPNGGIRSKVEAAIMKGMGVKSGVPDVHLPIACGQFIGLYIEMKTPGETLSPAQRKVQEDLREVGNKVVTCYRWEEAANEIRLYLKTGPAPIIERAVLPA